MLDVETKARRIRQFSLAALLAAGLATSPATAPAQELPAPPEEEWAALSHCEGWLEQLDQLIDEPEERVSPEARADAEKRRDDAAAACGDGRYRDGIAIAARAIDRLAEGAERTRHQSGT